MNFLNLHYSNQLITFQNHIISVIHSKFLKLNQLSDSIALTESEQILSSFIDFASELLFEASFGQDKNSTSEPSNSSEEEQGSYSSQEHEPSSSSEEQEPSSSSPLFVQELSSSLPKQEHYSFEQELASPEI